MKYFYKYTYKMNNKFIVKIFYFISLYVHCSNFIVEKISLSYKKKLMVSHL